MFPLEVTEDDGLVPVDHHAIAQVQVHSAREHQLPRSRPLRTRSSTASRWLTCATSCSMIGPWSSSGVA